VRGTKKGKWTVRSKFSEAYESLGQSLNGSKGGRHRGTWQGTIGHVLGKNREGGSKTSEKVDSTSFIRKPGWEFSKISRENRERAMRGSAAEAMCLQKRGVPVKTSHGVGVDLTRASKVVEEIGRRKQRRHLHKAFGGH